MFRQTYQAYHRQSASLKKTVVYKDADQLIAMARRAPTAEESTPPEDQEGHSRQFTDFWSTCQWVIHGRSYWPDIQGKIAWIITVNRWRIKGGWIRKFSCLDFQSMQMDKSMEMQDESMEFHNSIPYPSDNCLVCHETEGFIKFSSDWPYSWLPASLGTFAIYGI